MANIGTFAGAGGLTMSPDTLLIALAIALTALIVTNTALRRMRNATYQWWYAAVKLVAYGAMFVLSIATAGPIVSLSVLSTYVGMELQTLLLYAKELGIMIGSLFNGNGTNGSSKQTQ